MKVFLIDIILFFTIGGLMYHTTNAACNVCQKNNAACVNVTSYHLCYGGTQPNRAQLFTCPDGLVCSNLPNICFQRSTLLASCGDTSSCGKCNSNQVFACTSRTTFAFCFGATIPSDTVGSCPLGTICDASSSNFCVDQVTPTSIVCELNEPPVSLIKANIYHDDINNSNEN